MCSTIELFVVGLRAASYILMLLAQMCIVLFKTPTIETVAPAFPAMDPEVGSSISSSLRMFPADMESTDQPTQIRTANESLSSQQEAEERPATGTLGLDEAIDYLSSQLAEEDPDSYNAPTIPFPSFRDSTRIPPETHFFPPRHSNDGPSSEFLHSAMKKDMTPGNLLRLLLVHKVPVERLQVPFSDENITPEDLCTSFYCPIRGERKSSSPDPIARSVVLSLRNILIICA